MEANQLGQAWSSVPHIRGYEVVRRLGSGSQGHVWLLRNRSNQQLVAAKHFLPAGGVEADAEHLGRHRGRARGRVNESEITQEWRILAHFDHPHLIEFKEVVELDGPESTGKAILMEYAGGGSLLDLVAARGALSVGETVTVLTPLGQVLSYLHSQGVTHGDLSPGNVLFTAQGMPKLADLGFATLLGLGRDDAGGTVGFLAPEGPRGGEADVYSLAAIAWFALTAKAPSLTRDRIPLSLFVEDVPSALTAAIEAGLDEDPSQRPSAAAFSQAVFRSAKAEALSLAESVHPSVMPELLTQRAISREGRVAAWRGSLSRRITSRGMTRGEVHRPSAVPSGVRRSSAAPSASHLSKARVLIGAGVAAAVVVGAVTWGLQDRDGAQASSVNAGSAGVALSGGEKPMRLDVGPSSQKTVQQLMSVLPARTQRGLASAKPTEALAALAWVRSHAVATGDYELLRLVNAPGSSAAVTDAALVSKLAAAGHTYSGFSTEIGTPRIHTDSPDAAILLAPATTGPYTEHDAQGGLVFSQSDPQVHQLKFSLVRQNGQWLIAEILSSN